MNIQKEAYLNSFERQQRLTNFETQYRINRALNGRLTPPYPFLTKMQQGWDTVKRIRAIRIHVTYDLKEPANSVRANA